MTKIAMEAIMMPTINLPTNLYQVPISTRPSAKAPITIPDVGATKFKRPDAAWKAVITRLAGTFTNSPRGAMIPIEAPARPDEDGIKKDLGR